MGSFGFRGVNGRWIHTCGVSLISKTFALTAAHCLTTWDPDQLNRIKIRFGESDLLGVEDDDSVHESGIAGHLIHPLYEASEAYYDICLLRLDFPVEVFTNTVSPICLPKISSEDVNLRSDASVVIAGWGKLALNGAETSELLRSTTLTIFNQE